MTKLEIFKPGKHTAMNGTTLEFSEADLAATVAAYDPAKGEAPLVVGHPRTDDPAYGWVKKLEFGDGALQAEPTQVDPAFAEMVNSGRFKRVSASFYMPNAPGNPVPGVYYLRHVGFLGAQPPAVKGLKPASFSAFDEGIVTFCEEDRITLGLFRRLKNWLIGKDGADVAEGILPEDELAVLQEELIKDQCAPECCDPETAPSYQEETMKAEELIAKEAELQQREIALRAKEAQGRHSEHVGFCEGLVKEGRLLPAHQEQVVALLDFAADLPAGTTIEFSDGGGCKKKGPADLVRDLFAAQPKIVEFGEVAGGTYQEEHAAEFAAPVGYTVDPAGLELHRKALAYQAKNPGTDYLAAVKAVN